VFGFLFKIKIIVFRNIIFNKNKKRLNNKNKSKNSLIVINKIAYADLFNLLLFKSFFKAATIFIYRRLRTIKRYRLL